MGKSSFAIRLARELGLDVLSVDSMLVYRGLDIATAKPAVSARAGVPHYLVDILEPEEEFDAARFVREVAQTLQVAARPLLGVGGTPFYIRALLHGLASLPPARPYEEYLEGLDSPELWRWLQRLDPQRASVLHPHDRFRLVRALAIVLASGRKASAFRDTGPTALTGGPRLVGLKMDRAALHRRLERRIEEMFAQGLVEEARALWPRKLSRTAAAAVGYAELFEHFSGRLSLEDARQRMLQRTRRLVRHQETWFRKLPVQWIPLEEGGDEAAYRELRTLALEHYGGMAATPAVSPLRRS